MALFVLLTGLAQAAVKQWAGPQYGASDGVTWLADTNWYDHTTGLPGVPGSGDHAIVDGFMHWVGNIPAGAPVINTNVGSVAILWEGWGPNAVATVNIGPGGSIAASDHTRMGMGIDALGVLNIADGYHVTSLLQNGFNNTNENTGGSGIINLSGWAILHCGAAGFAQEDADYNLTPDQDGTGSVHISGNARFIVNNDLTSATGNGRADLWITNGWVDALGVPGSQIIATYYPSNNWTEFTLDTPAATADVFIDDFEVADTSDVNTDLGGRQAGGSLMAHYGNQQQYYSITNGMLHQNWPAAFLHSVVDLAPTMDQDCEFSFKLAHKETDGSWTMVYVEDENDAQRSGSNLGIMIQGAEPGALSLHHGYDPGQIGEGDVMAVGFSEVQVLLGDPSFSKSDLHEYKFVSHVGPGGTNTYDFLIDGTVIRTGLPYHMDGFTRHFGTVGTMSGTGEGAYIDDVNVRLRAASTNIFLDSFNTADTGNANKDTEARQADGQLLSHYVVTASAHSITNGKLHVKPTEAGAAWLVPQVDLTERVLGEDFEFSYKISQQETDSAWWAIYMHDDDDTPVADNRSDSRLGAHWWGNGHTAAVTVYYGAGGAQEATTLYDADLTAALGYTYDKTAENTVQFLSTEGEGGTNTFDFIINGVTILSGLEYSFNTDTRKIEMVGIHAAGGGGVFLDDLAVREYNAPTPPTYEGWVEDWAITGSDTNRTADIEPDGIENLLEYALGGNPFVNDAASILPTSTFPDSDNWEYVYRRRVDDDVRNLVYDLQYRTNLITQATWASSGGLFETGVGSIDTEFEAVTNTIPITTYGLDQAYLKLEVREY